MAEPVTFGTEPEKVDDGFAALAGLQDGFLGTGYSTSVELSFLAMAAILTWVTYETTRYLLAVTGLGERMVEKLRSRE